MTKLRILSGEHAGASIDWNHARLRVGRSEEHDVFIGDWDHLEIELQRDADGRCQARWKSNGAPASVACEQRDGDSLFCWLDELAPVRFGSVILCIGPEEGEWPSDALLLERCFAPPAVVAQVPLPAPRARANWRLLVIAAAMPIVAVAALTATRSGPSKAAVGTGKRAEPPTATATTADPVQRIRAAIAPHMLSELDVQRSGDRLIVRGVLASRAEVDQLNNRLDALGREQAISRRFIATPEIIDRLIEALPGRDLRVMQDGRDRFRVSGTVDDLVHANQAIAQVASDLAEFGLHIESDVQPRHTGMPALSGLLVGSDGTSVLRTSDGVKHIIVGRALKESSAAAPEAPARPLKSAQTQLENHDVY